MELISIYIPTKNRLDLLKQAVQSVINQTYPNWELIVVNDASTDGTKDYLDQLSKDNPKIKVIHHQESTGACIARNDAIFSARGKYITGLDDDDSFDKDRLERFIKGWEKKHKNVICLFTGTKRFINGNLKQTIRFRDGHIFTQENLISENRLNNQVFTKTENLLSIKGFDLKFKMWQDFDCWFRLLSLGDAQYIDNVSYNFDVSDRQDRITTKKKEILFKTYKQFIKKHKLSFFDQILLKQHFVFYGMLNNLLLFRLQRKLILIVKKIFRIQSSYPINY